MCTTNHTLSRPTLINTSNKSPFPNTKPKPRLEHPAVNKPWLPVSAWADCFLDIYTVFTRYPATCAPPVTCNLPPRDLLFPWRRWRPMRQAR